MLSSEYSEANNGMFWNSVSQLLVATHIPHNWGKGSEDY